MTELLGYPRQDDSKGIRNLVVVAYLVECAHHVSRHIVTRFPDQNVHLIGFPGCYPNTYAHRMMESICTHPNVGAVLLVSLGCESFARDVLAQHIAESGRPVETLVIQEEGGTRTTLEKGCAWVEQARAEIEQIERVPMGMDELVVGTICGGSDATTGLTANPAIGLAFDRLGSEGVACIFEETGELIGCEDHLARRATTDQLAQAVVQSVHKARHYYEQLGHGSFATGNAVGELTTQEEKSMGAYAKSGSAPIVGLIKPGDQAPTGGLYLLDVVPDGPVRFGFPNIADNAEITEMIACGCHLILFATGCGSVVGSAVSPVIKICSNPQTYARMSEDMDVNAGAILEGTASLPLIGEEAYNQVLAVSGGRQTQSEALGHQEFILTYKHFDPIGPGCLPVLPLHL